MTARNRMFTFILTGFITLMLSFSASGQAIHVDASVATSGDGTDWPVAFKTLQEGIAEAESRFGPDVIWVAAGTYRPDQDANDPGGDGNRFATFELPNETQIYGGFAGTEGDLDQRDIFANPTILSGDLNMPGISTDNSYHVVTVSNMEPQDSPRLDGFTVRDGNAVGGNDEQGGGLLISSASPWIVNCRFEHNNATRAARPRW